MAYNKSKKNLGNFMEEIKDYHCNLTLWQDLVKKGDLIYPNENVVRFIFANNFNSALDFGCGNGRHLEVFLRAKIKKIVDKIK